MDMDSIEALIRHTEQNQALKRLDIESQLSDGKLQLVAHSNGQQLRDFTEEAIGLGARPIRAKGEANLHNIASFIDWVNRQKGGDSAVFANNDPSTPHVVAVINYASGMDTPAWGDWRGRYKLARSREWNTWFGRDGKWSGQEEFGLFLEDNLADIAAPPGSDAASLAAKAQNPADVARYRAEAEEYALMVKLSGGNPSIGDSAQLIATARSLVVNESSILKSAIDIATGEAQMTYEAKHTGDAGGQVTVPRLFSICIPVFDGDAAYRIPVRLRYRKTENGSKVVFGTSLYQPERYLRDAWNFLMTQIAERTELPVFEGIPESPGVSGYIKPSPTR